MTKKTKAKTTKAKPKPKARRVVSKKPAPPVQVHILLDRSGSMGKNWVETIGAINAYVKGLIGIDARVTLAVFDTNPEFHGLGQVAFDYRVIRDRATPEEWYPLSVTEIRPRGGTPLYDAIGTLVERAGSPKKAVLVFMTDGEENSSTRFSREGARVALDRCRERGWQVVHLGVDFDAIAQAASVGTQLRQTITIAPHMLRQTMGIASGYTANYVMSGAPIEWTGADRQIAAGNVSNANKTAARTT